MMKIICNNSKKSLSQILKVKLKKEKMFAKVLTILKIAYTIKANIFLVIRKSH